MGLKNTIDSLIKDVNMSDMSDSEISLLRDKMKEVEKILKDKSKPKTITISGSCHKMVKEFCNENNLNIGEWVSKVLLDEVEKGGGIPFYKLNTFYKERFDSFSKNIDISLNCIINTTDEEECERIKKKYEKLKKSKRLYIKSKVDIDNDNTFLIGYDKSDGDFIYSVSGDFNTDGYMVADKINIRSISKTPLDENKLFNNNLYTDVKEVTPVDIVEASKLVDFNKNKKED